MKNIKLNSNKNEQKKEMSIATKLFFINILVYQEENNISNKYILNYI